MQIIETMENEKFDAVCESGVELLRVLKDIIEARGLSPEDSLAALTVACGGFVLLAGVSPKEFTANVGVAAQFWTKDDGGVTFNAPQPRAQGGN